MGTISTSSIFVNVDNQTEERYGKLPAFKPGASGHRVRHIFVFPIVKMLVEHMGSVMVAVPRVATKKEKKNRRTVILQSQLSSLDLTSFSYACHGKGDSPGVASSVQ